MMYRKIMFALLSIAFLLSYIPLPVQAGETFTEYKLSVLDSFNHSSEKFSLILDDISNYHSKYTRKEIGDLIISAYFAIKKYHLDVSVYKVAEGIKSFSRDTLGIDLKTLTYAYVLSRT